MKDNLAVNTDSKYIPKAFNNSHSLMEYVSNHPNTRVVQKLWSNRGVELKEAHEINFEIFGPGFKYFAQVYVENPLLIDGELISEIFNCSSTKSFPNLRSQV